MSAAARRGVRVVLGDRAVRAALGLGSNLGDRAEILRSAVAEIGAASRIRLVAVSSVYETPPVGGPAGQGPYLNAVVVVDTDLSHGELLELAHAIEDKHARVREERWGPRTLDIDLLAVGSVVVVTPELTIPHPRATERAFVLVPWAEVDPGFEVPGAGTVSTLLARLPVGDRADIRRVDVLLPTVGSDCGDQ
jgi:2-amino-4-hydroxy-6-hydroxymethyldihydropteridine diphosphokinase